MCSVTKMIAIIIAAVLIAAAEAVVPQPKQQLSIVPLSCYKFGLFCPAGYSGPGSATVASTATTVASTAASGTQLSLVPASCLMFALFCPTGYTGPRGRSLVETNADAKLKIVPENKLYFGPIPLPSSSSSMSVVPASCLMFNLFCPPNFVRPGTNPSSTPAGPPANLATQRQDALTNGNSYRAAHGASPQTIDTQLQAEAQAYAEYLATNSLFQHSQPNGAYGENLAKLPPEQTIANANTAWYGERPLYCPAGGSVNAQSGHFTQMIWKSSDKVGCGSAVGRDGYSYVVCRYTPPGNVIGMESANLQC